jgi:hypothetical protein
VPSEQFKAVFYDEPKMALISSNAIGQRIYFIFFGEINPKSSKTQSSGQTLSKSAKYLVEEIKSNAIYLHLFRLIP